MKPLVGLLLIISGFILAVPQIYEVLFYLDLDGWPLVQGILGIACIVSGLIFVIRQRKSSKKTLVEV